MSRQEAANSFLLYFKEWIMNNPNVSISRNDIYDALKSYGIANYNDSITYNKLFESWEKRYENASNINVYASEQQKGFLQFSNSHYKPNHIKIYLSIPSQYLEQATNIIFDYLAQNDIGHQSKVAIRDRSDVIVLRLEDLNDVPRVLNFINSNSYLKQTSRLVNPFSMNCGITGMTYDGLLSYNMPVSLILENYFNEKRNSNSLNEISLNDFRKYVDTYYQDVFINKNKLNSFLNNEEVKNEITRIKRYKPYEKNIVEKVLINYMHVINNLNVSLNSNNYDILMNNFKRYQNDINDQNLINSFSSSLRNIKEKNISPEEELLKDYIRYAYNKYGQNVKDITVKLLKFISDPKMITRDKGFRTNFKNYLNSDNIMSITNNNPYGYTNKVVDELISKSQIYEKACIYTYNKYDKGQLLYAIVKSLNNDFSGFTNSPGKLRDVLIDNFDEKDVEYSISTILMKNIDQNIEMSLQLLAQNIEDKMSYVPNSLNTR